jgi:hypothetical protein
MFSAKRHLRVSLYFAVAGAGVSFLFWVLLELGAAQAGMSASSSSVTLTHRTAALTTWCVAIYCALGFTAGLCRSFPIRIGYVVVAHLIVLSTTWFDSIQDVLFLMAILLLIFGASWWWLIFSDFNGAKGVSSEGN